jgi:hypothetical protein
LRISCSVQFSCEELHYVYRSAGYWIGDFTPCCISIDRAGPSAICPRAARGSVRDCVEATRGNEGRPTAKDVTFEPLKGQAKIKLSKLTKVGPVVLVVLRGFPGYQCPLCTRQVAELRRNAEDFAKLGAKVVLVYPGPGPTESLKKKAEQFLAGADFPKPFVMMVDPEYAFTNPYELR